MKILWFCNIPIVGTDSNTTGSWLHSMSRGLVDKGLEIICVTQKYGVKKIKKEQSDGIIQYILPCYKLKNGLPAHHEIESIIKIVNDNQPDIIHIWGMEMYWGLLASRGYFDRPSILEIQGIKDACARVYYGGLSTFDVLSTIGIIEILRPKTSIISRRRDFYRWGIYEKEMLSTARIVSTQSDWVTAYVNQYINKSCKVYRTRMSVRQSFLDAAPWKPRDEAMTSPSIFTLAAGPEPYKGVHDSIYILAMLTKNIPNIKLRIAGGFVSDKKWKNSGYTKYLLGLIKRLGLVNNVVFTGPLKADEIINTMYKSDVFIQTSYVESYSLAVAEAMAVGIPTVCSFSGAMPELAIDNVSALFYPCGDIYKAVYLIRKILSDRDLQLNLSRNSRIMALKRNDSSSVIGRQLEIYKDVVSKQ